MAGAAGPSAAWSGRIVLRHDSGQRSARWLSRFPAYHAVDLGEVYDRIGLTLRAHGDNVEKVFRVALGGDPGQIRLQLEGSQGLRITETGELEVATPEGPFRFSRPVAYQEDEGGRRTPVAVSYRLLDEPSVPANDFAVSAAGSYPADGRPVSSYAFALADYDRSRELVIDPLIAATYLGGSDGEWAEAVAAAPDGRVYVAGSTQSADFPKTEGLVADIGVDGFVALFNAGLTRLEAAVVFGGIGLATGADVSSMALRIESGAVAGVYVAGRAWGPDFPLVGGAFNRIRGAQDFFVARFSPDLSSLESSTAIGGSKNWVGRCGDYTDEWSSPSIALDGQGNVFLAGETGAWDYPTTADAYSRQCGRSGWCDHKFWSNSGVCPTMW
jgi:hypothetical protein